LTTDDLFIILYQISFKVKHFTKISAGSQLQINFTKNMVEVLERTKSDFKNA